MSDDKVRKIIITVQGVNVHKPVIEMEGEFTKREARKLSMAMQTTLVKDARIRFHKRTESAKAAREHDDALVAEEEEAVQKAKADAAKDNVVQFPDEIDEDALLDLQESEEVEESTENADEESSWLDGLGENEEATGEQESDDGKSDEQTEVDKDAEGIK